ncbi:MAG: PhoPQ-activated pathogenicity, partial [Candidatus Hydrogenedentes bacterium]|nr:PhoPQ-activated pathogenicity [Candidatus Hydrogenedentota bacterium]
MMKHRPFTVCMAIAGFLLIQLAGAGGLQDYVDRPDPSYRYQAVQTIPMQGMTAHVLDMTSQTWREGDVAPSKWEHWVTVVVPDNVVHDTALLLVSGGNNRHDKIPTDVPPPIAMIAMQTKSVVAILQGVPCEPVSFKDESRTRTEDEIIAYTYNKYLETGDPSWPLLCPMVKSAVRAMDSIQDFCGSRAEKKTPVKHFVVTGASKRGWTTWLTATVDPRVVAIAPIVIDMLNLDEQMKRQMAYYGQYSEAIQDYTDFKIQDRIGTSKGQDLLKIVDPYEYRDTLTLPKLVLLGSGDQYWTVEAANLYFPGLKGEKHIRYEANADHGVNDSADTIKALAAFYNDILTDTPRPSFTWALNSDGSFEVRPETPPLAVRLWMAKAPALDFRLQTIGPAWTSSSLTPDPDGVIRGKVEAPAEGHVAYYVELEYKSSLGYNYTLTTETSI